MKANIRFAAPLFLLAAACGGSNNGNSTLTSASLAGTWRSCVTISSHDDLSSLAFGGAVLTRSSASYVAGDGTCTGNQIVAGVQNTPFSLGSDVVAQLSSAPVTATELNLGAGKDASYTIAYVDTASSPRRLYLGDTSDPTHDGTTVQKRPTTLQNRPHLLTP